MLKVVEDEAKGVVMVDDLEVVGFIDDEPCPECTTLRIYSDKFDSYFCPRCNIWLESGCPDATCEYCRNRPSKPLPH